MVAFGLLSKVFLLLYLLCYWRFIKNLLQLSEVMAHGTAHRILNAGLLHTYSP